MLANVVALSKCYALQRWGFFSRKARDKAKIKQDLSPYSLDTEEKSRKKNQLQKYIVCPVIIDKRTLPFQTY